jgi:chemotaxis protein MotB
MAVSAPKPKKRRGGAPPWIVTFADLATLLLTFFILLLSFAEMDAEKYRAMADSMAAALGNVSATGNNSLLLPASPAEIRAVLPQGNGQPDIDAPAFVDSEMPVEAVSSEVPSGILALASGLIRELEPEIIDENLTVNYDNDKVMIRFSEEAAFRSGEATIKPGMLGIIERLVDVLSQCPGNILVAGYTDDRPIAGGRYRSNWDLSAARAVSVVHELVLNRQVPAQRVTAAGRAETNPLVPNDTAENRARNRRVEILIRDPECGIDGERRDS